VERAERRRWSSSGDGEGGGDDVAEGTVAVVVGKANDTCRLRFEADIEPLFAMQERRRTGGGNGTTAAGGRPRQGGSAA